MNETLEYLQTFARFPFALRRFLQHRLTLDEARNIVRGRMEEREENFLRIAEKSIYGNPHSPYLPLLRMAGCEFGDLRAHVRQKGIESTLRELRDQGVYVTFEELKGRKPIKRNGLEIRTTPRDFDNPFAHYDFTAHSSGSTGLALAVGQDLDHLAAMGVYHLLGLAAHHALDMPLAQWGHILPGGGLRSMLQRARFGKLPERWFVATGWHDSKSWVKYGAATYYMILCARLLGMRVPLPEYVRVNQALVIARWVHATLEQQGCCLLAAGVSHALRVCIAAQEAGLDLTGAVVFGGGEPATPAKIEGIQRANVRHISAYAMSEAGAMAFACAQPADYSDVHLLKDAYALIAYPFHVESAGVTVPALNVTSLLDTAPKVLLNAQIDDYGIIEERHCGCELESYGYTTHLHDIYSYSKLVGEGATLIGNEMLRILEQVLPARFGGSPLDYQLVEEEDQGGFTRLVLVISPRIEIAEEQEVIAVVHQALRNSSPMADAARGVWRSAQTLQVRRAEPVWTARGKLMPLHIQRQIQKP